MGKSTISMAIFNSYVCLPGRVNGIQTIQMDLVVEWDILIYSHSFSLIYRKRDGDGSKLLQEQYRLKCLFLGLTIHF
jgi:hypothetical protein